VGQFRQVERGVEWRSGEQFLLIQDWGPGSVRVRSGIGQLIPDLPGALVRQLPPAGPTTWSAVLPQGTIRGHRPDGGTAVVAHEGETAVVMTAGLQVEIGGTGMVRFSRAGGSELLAERRAHFAWPGPRHFDPIGDGRYRISQLFSAYDGERLYGLGQQQHGLLDQKGAVIDLVQRNGDVTIPFLLSSRGYGLLWNSPAVGQVELATTGTRWISDDARQIDYWLTTAGTPAEILRAYADATGHSPVLPEWATGFWQSKLRYRTQQELMQVAREYQRRGLPLAVIVADFYHWTALGDWKFDDAEWPDPRGMVDELASMGTRLMVSVWPSVNPVSENWRVLRERGLLVGTEFGLPGNTTWVDKPSSVPAQVSFYDPTNPEGRQFIWDTVERNYGRYGIDVFWLDACEPEITPLQPANLRLRAGRGSEVANLYPREHARAFWEGRTAAGQTDGLSLVRSAWAGSQRYGAALWSGDIGVDFPALRRQITAGLNAGISGIPWWCADIGGFHGGDPDDPAYREVMVRWFQFGALSPIFRMHGERAPRTAPGRHRTGGPNEIWAYGDQAYRIMIKYLRLRERLRPYIQQQMVAAAETGMPVMRALLLEFPADKRAWAVTDQYLLGPDLLVAPVLEPGATERAVYLPEGASWTRAGSLTTHPGGAFVTAGAPLDTMPLFVRDGAQLPVAEPADGEGPIPGRTASRDAAREG
jgi:alpha-D-xyloside xylohydrolase